MQSADEAQMPSDAIGTVSAPPEATVIQAADEPDEYWSDEMLLNFGREAMNKSDRFEALAEPYIRQSIGSRLHGGHALSILRARLRAEGRWISFQQQHDLPRTTVWQMAEVYERATADRLTAQDLAVAYSSWTGILLAYGLVQPRKTDGGGCVVEQVAPPSDDENDAEHDVVENESDRKDSDGESPEDLTEEIDSEDESPDAESQETVEEEPPPVTDDQATAADVYVGAVGGLAHAIRVLMARGIRDGNKEAVREALAEAVRATRAVLTPAEISEIVIVGNGKAQGIDWARV